jgi:acetylglutamate kinase
MNDFMEKAPVLIEALPYIQRFFGKTIVIKYGGAAMVDEDLKNKVMLDIVLLKYVGLNPVLVHGGGPEITKMLERVGKTTEFVNGLRITDDETMEIAEMILSGKVNKGIVALINKSGGRAVGLSGKDANLITAKKYMATVKNNASTSETELVDIGYVGDVEAITPDIINVLSKEGYIPVISSIGVGADGKAYNINADIVAGEIARALKADKLLMLTDVEGIFERFGDEKSLISTLTLAEARALLASDKLGGGMLPKLQACIRAVESGVNGAHIIDGRKPHSILLELFTDEGIGTMIVA